MEELSVQDLVKFWQNGKPINKAIWAYCDKELLTQYSQIRLPDNSANNDYSIQKAAQNLLNVSRYQSDQKSALTKLYVNLSEKILSAKLIAIGYKSPIETDYPNLIPHHMWPPETVDLDKSSISANDIEYVRVRIIKPPRIKTGGEKKHPKNKGEIVLHDTELPNKPVGRPSIRPLIIEAYEFLKERGKIDYSKSLRLHTELIQKTVHILHPEITSVAGMQMEAIRRTLRERFNADKSASKSTSKL